MGVITMPDLILLVPIFLTMIYVPGLFVLSTVIQFVHCRIRHITSEVDITWRQWMMLLGTLGVIIASVALVYFLGDYESLTVTLLVTLHMGFFPIQWATALFYFFKRPDSRYSLGRYSMKTVWAVYLLIEAGLIVIMYLGWSFPHWWNTFLLPVGVIFPALFLLLAVVSILFTSMKRMKQKGTPEKTSGE